jgi:hypothetical protein
MPTSTPLALGLLSPPPTRTDLVGARTSSPDIVLLGMNGSEDTLLMFEDWRENAIDAVAKSLNDGAAIYDASFCGSISAPTAQVAGSILISMIDDLVHSTTGETSWTPPSDRPSCRLPSHIVALIHPAAFNYFNMCAACSSFTSCVR